MKGTRKPLKIDDLGRIVIPIEYRRGLGISKQDRLEIYTEDDRLIISKATNPSDSCIICGSSNGLNSVKRKAVCGDCVREMNEL